MQPRGKDDKRVWKNSPTDFWPTTLLRRTSVLPQAKLRRRRNSLPPSTSNFLGYHKNNHTRAGVAIFMEGTVKIDILKSRKGIGESPNRPSGPRRFCAVQVFSPQEKTLAQGEFISPEHFKPKGGAALRAVKPKKKDICFADVFLFGGGEASRTPVRKQFHGTFSGRRRLFRAALPPCSPPARQAVTPRGQVRVMMRGRVNSFPPHGRHINDALAGLWPLRLKTAAFS